jgi:hypothetical protein
VRDLSVGSTLFILYAEKKVRSVDGFVCVHVNMYVNIYVGCVCVNAFCVTLPPQMFLDMSEGIRQENVNCSLLIKAPMSYVVATSDKLLDLVDYPVSERTCFTCGKKRGEHELQTCARCKLAKYCGRECQTADWKAGHKAVCKHAATLQRIAALGRRVATPDGDVPFEWARLKSLPEPLAREVDVLD